jgi:hypothetical protein
LSQAASNELMGTIGTGLIAHVVPDLERLLNRHVLGVQPDPDAWPRPRDIGRLPTPTGIETVDDDGRMLILAREFTHAWHRGRTAIGAHAYRFEQNREYDCGWRLADVAARLLAAEEATPIDLVTIVPPPDTYGRRRVLPWIAARLADLLDAKYEPNLLSTVCPLAKHPDIAQRLKLAPTDVFRINDTVNVPLDGQRVLLTDWRHYRGKTLRLLSRLLGKQGADVIRFAFLG